LLLSLVVVVVAAAVLSCKFAQFSLKREREIEDLKRELAR